MAHTNRMDLIHSFQSTETSEGNFRGLTKREYFAAMALQGLLADSNGSGIFTEYAQDAVNFADALIEQLNKSDI